MARTMSLNAKKRRDVSFSDLGPLRTISPCTVKAIDDARIAGVIHQAGAGIQGHGNPVLAIFHDARGFEAVVRNVVDGRKAHLEKNSC